VKSVGLDERPVRKIGRPTKFVQYKSQRPAFEFIRHVLTDKRGIGWLHGPEPLGRLALIKQYVQHLDKDLAIAAVDGARLKTPQLLSEILVRFGYNVELNSSEELLNMLQVFAAQQTRSYKAPVLILENINDMYPSALCVLCKLAAMQANNQFALRIVLVGDRCFDRIMESPSMRPIAERMIGSHELSPLTANESLGYMYTILQSSGIERSESIFSIDVCSELHAASGGWPSTLDGIAIAILVQAANFPIRLQDIDHPAINIEDACNASIDIASDSEVVADVDIDVVSEEKAPDDIWPRLIVTRNGKTLQEIHLSSSSILIGRSDVCDLAIDDEFASKQHAALIRIENTVIIVDLKSRNGTYVNARRTQRRVLRDSDIVSLGEHRLKVIYPVGYAQAEFVDSNNADTATMMTITESRREESGQILPVLSVEKHTT